MKNKLFALSVLTLSVSINVMNLISIYDNDNVMGRFFLMVSWFTDYYNKFTRRNLNFRVFIKQELTLPPKVSTTDK